MITFVIWLPIIGDGTTKIVNGKFLQNFYRPDFFDVTIQSFGSQQTFNNKMLCLVTATKENMDLLETLSGEIAEVV